MAKNIGSQIRQKGDLLIWKGTGVAGDTITPLWYLISLPSVKAGMIQASLSIDGDTKTLNFTHSRPDKETWDFIMDYNTAFAVSGAASSPAEPARTFIDADYTEDQAGTDESKMFYFMFIGGEVDRKGSEKERIVLHGRATMNVDVGNFTWDYNTWTDMTMNLNLTPVASSLDFTFTSLDLPDDATTEATTKWEADLAALKTYGTTTSASQITMDPTKYLNVTVFNE